MNKEYKIYILREPNTRLIRYVGQTITLLRRRLSYHLADIYKDNNHKTCWLKSLKNKGLKPTIEQIDKYDNQNDCDEAEKFYIKTFKQIGYKLTNTYEGGESRRGYVVSEETKQKLRDYNKKFPFKHSMETRKIMSEIQKQRFNKFPEKFSGSNRHYKVSEESRKKMSIAQKNRNPEINKRISEILKGRKQSAETIAKRVESIKQINKTRIHPLIGRKQSPEQIEKRMKKIRGVKKSPEHIEKVAKCRRKKISQFDLSGNFIKDWDSIRDAHKSCGFTETCISRCCSGKIKHHKGFIFKYKNGKV